MAIPQETDPPGDVVREALRIAARVLAEDAVKELAGDLLDFRKALKIAIRQRQDDEDQTILADGALNSRTAATNSEIIAFGTKLVGRFVLPGKPGSEHPEFLRLFAERPPSALLPDIRVDRTLALTEFSARIALRRTSAEVKRDAVGVQKAIARELAAVATRAEAQARLDLALESEAAAKTAVILAARSCAGHLQARLPAEPRRVRRLLGQKLGGPGRKKAKPDESDAPPPPEENKPAT